MKRKFSAATSTIGRYLSLIDKNTSTWYKVFPKSAGPDLDFYRGQKVDNKAIDYHLNIMWDMLLRKGKKIRPVLMLLLADIYGASHKVALPLSFFVETVHNGTLVIDDIEDNSQSRRGEPCSHLKFGVDNSINAGALSFFLPAHNLIRLLDEDGLDKATTAAMLRLYIEEMTNLHLGLAWDIHWHGRAFKPEELPNEDNYLKMVESKTSVLLRIGFRLVAEAKKLPEAEKQQISLLANLIGQSFQIQDDIINLRSQAYSAGRGVGVGEDITEGKITLMVIEHVRRTQDKWLLDVLGSKTTDQNLINQAIDKMERSGAIDYADTAQRAIMSQAIDLLDKLEPKNVHKKEMKEVLHDLLERKT